MKYIFFTISGEGLPIAYRLKQEGNEVVVGVVEDWKDLSIPQKETEHEKEKRLILYDNLLDKYPARKLLKAMSKIKNKDDYFVFIDFPYLWRISVEVRKMGFKGLLPHHTDFLLEEQREKAQELVERLYPAFSKKPHFEFQKIEEALSFLEEHKDEIDEENYEQIVSELKDNRQIYEKEGFILEKKITDLIEFTPEAIAFDGEILGMNIDIENKPIGSGNLGHQTGCSQDTVFWIDSEEIFEMFLKPLWDYWLSKRRNELVYWDAGVLYSPSENKFYFSEYCIRPGYNSIFTELSTLPSVSEFFEKLVRKEKIFTPSVKRIGASVRLFDLTVKPERPLSQTQSIISVNLENKNVWVWDIFKKGEEYYKTGGAPEVAIITGAGDTLKEAAENCYSLLSKEPSRGFVLKGNHPEASTVVPADKGEVSFAGMYYRPLSDFLSFDYPTSIPNRLLFLKELFDLPIELE